MPDLNGNIRPPSTQQLASAGRVTAGQRFDAVRGVAYLVPEVTGKRQPGSMAIEEARVVLEHLGLIDAEAEDRRETQARFRTVPCPVCGAPAGRGCPGRTHTARVEYAIAEGGEVSGG